MKALKIIGITLAVLVIVFLAIGFIVPTRYSVQRSVVINKSRSEIYPLISTLHNMQRWSPWAELDPTMKVSYRGTDGTAGAISTWEGNDEVGKGEQEIKELKENEWVHNEVRFMEPFESVGQVFYVLEDEGAGTKVTWKMEGNNPYPWNALSIFMDMDNMIGKDFDKGLAKLRTLSE